VKPWRFDVEVLYGGRSLDVEGMATSPVPARTSGPADCWAPAEGGELEDVRVWLKRRAYKPDGPWRRRELCAKVVAGLDLEELVWQKLEEDPRC
jgi:hypothetical protein